MQNSCLTRGKRVFACIRNDFKAKKLKELNNKHLFIFSLDVSKTSDIEVCYNNVKSKTSSIDLLINNAGIHSNSDDICSYERNMTLGELEPNGLYKMLHVNAIAPVLITQQFLPLLLNSNNPKVLNISSRKGSIDWEEQGNYGYRSSKATLNMFTNILANDLKTKGIIIVAINPGSVRTDMGGPNADLEPEESVAHILKVANAVTLNDSGKVICSYGNCL